MRSIKSLTISLVILLALLLTACAVQPAATSPPEAELPQPAVRTSEPTSSPAAAGPTETVILENNPTRGTEPAATATDTPTEAQPLFDGLPIGQTEDGFYFLGQPEAPVTLIDYSDFL
jgi:hypothetical protein